MKGTSMSRLFSKGIAIVLLAVIVVLSGCTSDQP